MPIYGPVSRRTLIARLRSLGWDGPFVGGGEHPQLMTNGPAEVLSALQQARVEKLVMTDDFSAPGWADFSADVVDVGAIPDQHPTGGERGQIVSILVEDEMIRRALLSGAKTEVMLTAVPRPGAEDALPAAEESLPRSESARQLDGLGGVGALLRFG